MIIKDYSSCPPKKRPIPSPSPDFPYYGVNENNEPEDLSLKNRQRTKEFEISNPFSLVPNLNLKSTLPFPPPKPYNTPQPNNSPLVEEVNNNYIGNEGLRLISEVASKVEALRPSVLRGSIGKIPVQSKTVYTPTTLPSSVSRVTLGERGRWAYHPYLPMAVYGLPTTRYTLSKPIFHRPQPLKEINLKTRGSSVSPQPDDRPESSSGSEGSPELRGEKLTCQDCGRGYATVAGLSRHHQFHCTKEVTKVFSCRDCPKTYTSMGALKMHIRTHTLPCKCNICGKAFSRPWLLQGHIRTHTGEKPFECPQCHRSFADRSNLRAHLQTHAEVKKYACSNCPKTFSRMSLLIKHQDHGCPGNVPHHKHHIISSSIPAM